MEKLEKQLFIRFLKNNNAYNAYVYNCIYCSPSPFKGLYTLKWTSPNLWISHAFKYNSTPQGFELWHALSRAWNFWMEHRIMSEIIKKDEKRVF